MGVRIRPYIEEGKPFRFPDDFGRRYEGKYLLDNLDELDDLARSFHLSPLSDFLSFPRSAVMEQMGLDAAEAAEMEADAEYHNGAWMLDGALLWHDAERWFPAEAGLQTVRGLLTALNAQPGDLAEEDKEGVVEALESLGSVLESAAQEQRRFHLA